MTSSDLAVIRAFEERAFNAWPARQTVCFNGWLFRMAGGFTKRANSVNALQPGAAFDGVRVAAEALYAQHGLPAVFRLSPLASTEAGDELADAGYAAFDPTHVAVSSLAGAERHASVQIASAPLPEWLDGFAAANGIGTSQRPMHDAIVQAIALPAAFATLHSQGDAIGFGLAVLERGAVGLYDIVIDPSKRGQGHGGTLTRALLHWGREQGASSAYLQVREQNESARRLYAGLGFEDLYRYHYRVPSPAPALSR
jgi:N-acetylglutamate synthase